MANINKKRDYQYAAAMSDYLLQTEWNHFVTLTTGYTLTLNAARRLAERFHKIISKELFLPYFNTCKLFFVAEKFQVKDGFHLHGLLAYEAKYLPAWIDIKPELDRCYQRASGFHLHASCIIALPIFFTRSEVEAGLNATNRKNFNTIEAAGDNETVITKFRCSFSDYDKEKAGARYCTKYLVKKYSDYDLLI